MVLNSDSDSDLSDLDDGFEKREIRPMSKASAPWTQERSRVEGYVLSRPPKRRRDDGAFRHLVRSGDENAEMERQIAEAQAEMERPLRAETPIDHLTISEEMLAGALKDDPDPERAKKIYTAMQRTNALHVDCAFHLFGHNPETSPSSMPSIPPFPTNILPQCRSLSMFQGPNPSLAARATKLTTPKILLAGIKLLYPALRATSSGRSSQKSSLSG